MGELAPLEQPGRDDILEFYRALTSEQVMEGIARAVRASDFEAALTMLEVLAGKDPGQAEIICGAIAAVLSAGGETEDDSDDA
jgi:hypothetical protein